MRPGRPTSHPPPGPGGPSARAARERPREDLGPSEPLEQGRAAGPTANPVAQVAGKPARDERLEEELGKPRRQIGEDVPGEVLADGPAARRRDAQDPPPLVGGLAPGREMEELEAGGPSLGPARERRDVARRDR